MAVDLVGAIEAVDEEVAESSVGQAPAVVARGRLARRAERLCRRRRRHPLAGVCPAVRSNIFKSKRLSTDY